MTFNKALFYTRLALLIAGVFCATPALACAPAPSCWYEQGPSYVRSVCHSMAASPGWSKYVEEPELVPAFIAKCSKLNIKVSR